ncbi:MAG: hypothetical protein GY929_13225 [Actinomycetia bacterium]|nr:hypothetical protein [Actinomycetes bacterium]
MRARIGLVAILVLVASACASSAPSTDRYQTASGESYTLDELDGRASVVLFWDPD